VPNPVPRARTSTGRSVGLVVLSGAVVAVDQLTKAWVRADLPLDHPSVTVVPHVLSLRQVRNDGIAFGLLGGLGGALALASAVVALLLFFFISRLPDSSRASAVGVALIGGGAIGNLVDRVAAGEVVDFLKLPHWPWFNVADVGITLGVVVVVLAQLRDAASERAADAGREG
jgi:signal peptidase II